jgi:hypothetical protein
MRDVTLDVDERNTTDLSSIHASARTSRFANTSAAAIANNDAECFMPTIAHESRMARVRRWARARALDRHSRAPREVCRLLALPATAVPPAAPMLRESRTRIHPSITSPIL